MAIEGGSPRDLFRSFVRDLLDSGASGNQIIRSAADAGVGIRRADALGIIREERALLAEPAELAFTAPTLEEITGAPTFRWGSESQSTDEWTRFDGPSAILFQQNGANAAEWTDYLIPPEDEDVIGFRLVVADDEYVRDDGSNPGYRTSQSFDATIPVADALARLGLNPGDVARVIYDRP